MEQPKKFDLKEQLKTLEGWSHLGNSIKKVVKFKTYLKGIQFVNDLAKISEENNHHPDIEIVWCKVTIAFTSHDQGCLTERDIKMTHATDLILNQY